MANIVTGKIINNEINNIPNSNVRIVLNDLDAAKTYVTDFKPKLKDVTKKRNIGMIGTLILIGIYGLLCYFVPWGNISNISNIQNATFMVPFIIKLLIAIGLFVVLLPIYSYFNRMWGNNDKQLHDYKETVSALRLCKIILKNKDALILRQSEKLYNDYDCYYDILTLEPYKPSDSEMVTIPNTSKAISVGAKIYISNTLYRESETNDVDIEIIGTFNNDCYLFSEIRNI